MKSLQKGLIWIINLCAYKNYEVQLKTASPEMPSIDFPTKSYFIKMPEPLKQNTKIAPIPKHSVI